MRSAQLARAFGHARAPLRFAITDLPRLQGRMEAACAVQPLTNSISTAHEGSPGIGHDETFGKSRVGSFPQAATEHFFWSDFVQYLPFNHSRTRSSVSGQASYLILVRYCTSTNRGHLHLSFHLSLLNSFSRAYCKRAWKFEVVRIFHIHHTITYLFF